MGAVPVEGHVDLGGGRGAGRERQRAVRAAVSGRPEGHRRGQLVALGQRDREGHRDRAGAARPGLGDPARSELVGGRRGVGGASGDDHAGEPDGALGGDRNAFRDAGTDIGLGEGDGLPHGRRLRRRHVEPQHVAIAGADVNPPLAGGGRAELDGAPDVRRPDRSQLARRRRRARRRRARAGNQLAQGVGLQHRADAGTGTGVDDDPDDGGGGVDAVGGHHRRAGPEAVDQAAVGHVGQRGRVGIVDAEPERAQAVVVAGVE